MLQVIQVKSDSDTQVRYLTLNAYAPDTNSRPILHRGIPLLCASCWGWGLGRRVSGHFRIHQLLQQTSSGPSCHTAPLTSASYNTSYNTAPLTFASCNTYILQNIIQYSTFKFNFCFLPHITQTSASSSKYIQPVLTCILYNNDNNNTIAGFNTQNLSQQINLIL